MNSYNVVMAEEFFGAVKRGAFDHWQGETVPVRGPNREIIGEATIKSVDHREDGNVYVIVESQLDLNHTGIRNIAEILRGSDMPAMSFRFRPEDVVLPHQPKRDDDVARWLKAKRDEYGCRGVAERFGGMAIDGLLDDYRARADYGLTLDDDMSQLEGKW